MLEVAKTSIFLPWTAPAVAFGQKETVEEGRHRANQKSPAPRVKKGVALNHPAHGGVKYFGMDEVGKRCLNLRYENQMGFNCCHVPFRFNAAS